MDPFSLLEDNFTDPLARTLVVEHSRLVAAKALQIARRAADPSLDLPFIAEAALLHDIGVCRTDAAGLGCSGPLPYICHGIAGREILEAAGLPRHALVCERHIGVGLSAADIRAQRLPLPLRDMVPLSREERIVCLADLFYSKRPDTLREEKPVAAVRLELAKHGEAKAAVFDAWLAEFRLDC